MGDHESYERKYAQFGEYLFSLIINLDHYHSSSIRIRSPDTHRGCDGS